MESNSVSSSLLGSVSASGLSLTSKGIEASANSSLLNQGGIGINGAGGASNIPGSHDSSSGAASIAIGSSSSSVAATIGKKVATAGNGSNGVSAASNKNSLATALLMAFNFISAVFIVFINKILIDNYSFRYSTFITCCHFIVTFFGM